MKKIIGLFVMALGLSVVLVSCAKQDVEDTLFQSVAHNKRDISDNMYQQGQVSMRSSEYSTVTLLDVKYTLLESDDEKAKLKAIYKGKNYVILSVVDTKTTMVWSEDNELLIKLRTNDSGELEVLETSLELDAEPFLECVARVFSTAQGACNSDPECNLMCNAIDIGTAWHYGVPACTAMMFVSSVAACAMH